MGYGAKYPESDDSDSDNDTGFIEKEDKKQMIKAIRDRPPPEQKALPPSTRPGPKEPTPGQAAEVFSENADDGKFKETKKEEENLPLNVVQCWAPGTVGSSKDHAPSYEFGNRPAIFKAEGNSNTREGYRAALFREIEAAPVDDPDSGRVEELPDDDGAPGGSGGGDAPGGSGAGGAAGGSGGDAGGGNTPAAA